MDQPANPIPSPVNRKEFYEQVKKSYLLQFKTTGYEEVRATPLVEVFSVTIHKNQRKLFEDGEPCQIYGTIRVKDAEGTSFELYNRELIEPEIVYIGSSLSLTGPNGGAISPCGALEVEFDLKDKARGIEIAKDVLVLEYETREDYDRVITKYVQGRHGRAAVRYITYQSAVIANVEVSFRNNEDANVYGSVRACCVRGDEFPFNDFEEEYSRKKEFASSLLFERPVTQPAKVKAWTSLGLSRYVVAVPAHSCLLIDVNLSSCDSHPKKVSGIMKFLAKHKGVVMEAVKEKKRPDLARAVVLWSHAHVQRSMQQELIRVEDPFNKGREETKIMPCKNAQPLSPKQPQLECLLMEIFSVSICCNHDKPIGVYGTIKVQDECGSHYIFNKDHGSSPEKLYLDNKLPCVGLNSFIGHELLIDVDLTDVEGRIVSKGKIMWDKENIKFPRPWYDTLLCSVIPGEQQSYARVHYTILSSGIQAKVSVCFSSNSDANFPVNVRGSVVALYNCHDYSTFYERKYYKSVLFATNPENPLLLSSKSEIQLSKCIVSVPEDSYLIIEADLQADMVVPCGGGDIDDMSSQMIDSWCKKLLVVTDKYGRFHQVLRGTYYQIDLLVEMGSER